MDPFALPEITGQIQRFVSSRPLVSAVSRSFQEGYDLVVGEINEQMKSHLDRNYPLWNPTIIVDPHLHTNVIRFLLAKSIVDNDMDAFYAMVNYYMADPFLMMLVFDVIFINGMDAIGTRIYRQYRDDILNHLTVLIGHIQNAPSNVYSVHEYMATLPQYARINIEHHILLAVLYYLQIAGDDVVSYAVDLIPPAQSNIQGILLGDANERIASAMQRKGARPGRELSFQHQLGELRNYHHRPIPSEVRFDRDIFRTTSYQWIRSADFYLIGTNINENAWEFPSEVYDMDAEDGSIQMAKKYATYLRKDGPITGLTQDDTPIPLLTLYLAQDVWNPQNINITDSMIHREFKYMATLLRGIPFTPSVIEDINNLEEY